MININDYNKIKLNIKNNIKNNPNQLLLFLQKFYSINVIREIMGQNNDFKRELNTLVIGYLEELYDSEEAKSLIELKEDNKSIAVTTMALLETCFPEFLDGTFNPSTVNLESREIANMLFKRSNIYKYSTSDFRKELNKKMTQEDIKFNRENSKEVQVNLELVNLLKEDYKIKTIQR